jgi:hypothetical protein
VVAIAGRLDAVAHRAQLGAQLAQIFFQPAQRVAGHALRPFHLFGQPHGFNQRQPADGLGLGGGQRSQQLALGRQQVVHQLAIYTHHAAGLGELDGQALVVVDGGGRGAFEPQQAVEAAGEDG